ncbi:hypothetical protein CJ179_47185 [Rhodococcus sp. ACS1]|nr:hypothetical protein CJ179_47185 [Rhodococcus sp. ACS1]
MTVITPAAPRLTWNEYVAGARLKVPEVEMLSIGEALWSNIGRGLSMAMAYGAANAICKEY